jgi:hypothetical protein
MEASKFVNDRGSAIDCRIIVLRVYPELGRRIKLSQGSARRGASSAEHAAGRVALASTDGIALRIESSRPCASA